MVIQFFFYTLPTNSSTVIAIFGNYSMTFGEIVREMAPNGPTKVFRANLTHTVVDHLLWWVLIDKITWYG